jgi:hypothetical protein
MTDFESAASELSTLKDDQLGTVARLVETMQHWQRTVASCEEALKAASRELRRVQEEQLPAALQELGVSSVTMNDGSKLVLKEEVKASISKDREAVAFSWLRDHGFESLIKNVVSVPFGRGEDERAARLVRLLDQDGFAPNQELWVEPMTLKAFVKEQLRNGTPVPEDIFGVYMFNKATIVPPKAKRK